MLAFDEYAGAYLLEARRAYQLESNQLCYLLVFPANRILNRSLFFLYIVLVNSSGVGGANRD